MQLKDEILTTITEIEKDFYKKIEFADLIISTKEFLNTLDENHTEHEQVLINSSLVDISKMLKDIEKI